MRKSRFRRKEGHAAPYLLTFRMSVSLPSATSTRQERISKEHLSWGYQIDGN